MSTAAAPAAAPAPPQAAAPSKAAAAPAPPPAAAQLWGDAGGLGVLPAFSPTLGCVFRGWWHTRKPRCGQLGVWVVWLGGRALLLTSGHLCPRCFTTPYIHQVPPRPQPPAQPLPPSPRVSLLWKNDDAPMFSC